MVPPPGAGPGPSRLMAPSVPAAFGAQLSMGTPRPPARKGHPPQGARVDMDVIPGRECARHFSKRSRLIACDLQALRDRRDHTGQTQKVPVYSLRKVARSN